MDVRPIVTGRERETPSDDKKAQTTEGEVDMNKTKALLNQFDRSVQIAVAQQSQDPKFLR